jgi:uncharacterized spore protein YtfJ
MSIVIDGIDRSMDRAEEFPAAFMEKLFVAAQPGAVFGAPVVSGEYTVITASEIGAGGGFGSGRGTQFASAARTAEIGAPPSGEGGGMGGGGGASGRPIAAIVIGPNGVTVRPIFDITKIALAGITAWGAMLALALKLRAKSR